MLMKIMTSDTDVTKFVINNLPKEYNTERKDYKKTGQQKSQNNHWILYGLPTQVVP
jgi:hypothetical protein